MNTCFIGGCSTEIHYICMCSVGQVYLCRDHLQFHRADSTKVHNIQELNSHVPIFMKSLKDSIAQVTRKIIIETTESIKLIKHQALCDLQLLEKIQATLNSDYSSGALPTNNIHMKFRKLVSSGDPTFQNHFKPFLESVGGICNKFYAEVRRMQVERDPRPSSAASLNSRNRNPEYARVPGNQEPESRTIDPRGQGVEEKWYMAPPNRPLKPLPQFVVNQIIEGRAQGKDQIPILNNGKLSNFVDITAMRYYWCEPDGSLQPNYQRLAKTLKKSNRP